MFSVCRTGDDELQVECAAQLWTSQHWSESCASHAHSMRVAMRLLARELCEIGRPRERPKANAPLSRARRKPARPAGRKFVRIQILAPSPRLPLLPGERSACNLQSLARSLAPTWTPSERVQQPMGQSHSKSHKPAIEREKEQKE